MEKFDKFVKKLKFISKTATDRESDDPNGIFKMLFR